MAWKTSLNLCVKVSIISLLLIVVLRVATFDGSRSQWQNVILEIPEIKYKGSLSPTSISQKTIRIPGNDCISQESEFNIFGFWESGGNTQIDHRHQKQLIMWSRSILNFHVSSQIYLITRKELVPKRLIPFPDSPPFEIDSFNICYQENMSHLFEDTPLETFDLRKTATLPQYSDAVRLALLYRFGGSWIDTDDILVRPLTNLSNLIGTRIFRILMKILQTLVSSILKELQQSI